jgi:RND family efflux transporter MFP subunit
LALAGYFALGKFFKKGEVNRYILTPVQKGTILVSVSGSGQISTSDQIEIKPKVSGEVLKIYVDDNQKVRLGDLLLGLDSEDYQRAIDDAKLALDNAKTSLENLKKNKEDAQRDLNDSYENSFNSISQTFNDLPQIIQTIEPIFTESSYDGDRGDIDYYRYLVGIYSGQLFPKNEKENQFIKLNEKYQEIRDKFLLLSKNSPREVLEEWLKNTSDLVKEVSDLTRLGRDIISFYKETIQKQSLTPPISLSATENHLTTLTNFTTSLDQRYSTLFSLSKTIDQLKTSISNYEDSIRSQEKIVEQKENALSDARENYENCFIKAPYDGIVAKVNVKKGDIVSSATSLFTFISTQKIAELTLNEIDAAKVKIGQKATLTFDALPDLTLTGKVTEIDTLGTVSQGVVSYGVKIALDTDDERIKPGMSVTADIIVDVKTDTLVLPNSAVKSQAGSYYVELVEIPEKKKEEFLNNKTGVILPNPPKRQIIEVGLSNDALTEISSGLKEGDIVVSSTIGQQTQTTQTQNQFRFQIPGMTPQRR